MKVFFFTTFILFFPLFANEAFFRDLETIYRVSNALSPLPVPTNHLLLGGYLNMPSARMSTSGELSVGFTYLSPYRLYNARLQLFDRIELSANYRVFHNVQDAVLSPTGFGDFSDKGANIKYALILPETSGYSLPGITVGWEDFIGTKSFETAYVVATQVFPNQNFECTVGYGIKRYEGFFGGVSWSPLPNLHLIAEYDATNYKEDPHPKGRSQRSKWNFGVKGHLFDCADFSLSYVRGEKIAASLSTTYNFGTTCGFVPKLYNPPYPTLKNTSTEYSEAFYEQGFTLLCQWIDRDCRGNKINRLLIQNRQWLNRAVIRERIGSLLESLDQSTIPYTVVTYVGEQFPLFEMHFHKQFSLPYEQEIQFPNRSYKTNTFSWILMPKTHFLFGSAKGKLKGAIGIQAGVSGTFSHQLYYSLRIGWLFLSNLYDIHDVDKLNPSQVINVKTDIIRYCQNKWPTLDEAYLQKGWNLGNGFYSRVAVGYFEPAYAGLGTELLYAPFCSDLSFGLEAALLRKRNYSGLGFSDKVRQLNDFNADYRGFLGSQYFASLYYDHKPLYTRFQIKGGKFLANDWGARFEMTRYFPSGLEVSFWYTYTDGNDRINSHSYHDKGISFSLPLDIFCMRSRKERFGYGMSAWLRDVGVVAYTGQSLYSLLKEDTTSP